VKRDLLSLADVTPAEIDDLLSLALDLKARRKRGESTPLLADKALAVYLEKPSLRTRASFEVGMVQLGGAVTTLRREEVGLGARAGDLAGSLPYAEQKRLEIARALATEPFLLMLDEPAAGMNPAETAELERMVLALVARHSLAVVLIEHDMRLVMGLSRHIVVLNQGRVIAEGAPQEIQSNPEVIRAYLGDEALAHA